MDMLLKFVGGAESIGSLGLVLEIDDIRILFDYGLTPTKPPKYPLLPPEVDATFLTHAHLDHSGMLPIVAERFSSTIYATPPTIPLVEILLNDTIKVCDVEGYGRPYSYQDVELTLSMMREVGYRDKILLGDVEIELFRAGHIPGSTMYRINGDEKILFTGDIQTINTNLQEGSEIPKADILIIESTYAGVEHPPREEVVRSFLDSIDETLTRGGVVVVPAFAVGRTQEILLVLYNKGYEIWLDGMGAKIAKILLSYPEYIREPERLKKAIRSVNIVKGDRDRKKALKGDVILTTSGMLDGGPVLYYLNILKNDRNSGIFLTGHQMVGTNGRLLLETGMIDLYGVREKVEANVKFFDFSAHAGHSDLLEFIYRTGASKIVLCHGDNRDRLKNEILDAEVITPRTEEIIIM